MIARRAIETAPAGGDDWATVRELRLAALRDSPDWFWSTLEEEVDRPEAWWRSFIAAGGWFLGYVGRRAVGIVGVIRRDERHQLISMWVAPDARRAGVGRGLVEAAAQWARADGAQELQLEVTSGNDEALRLYERCGFEMTGETEPHPRKPELVEREMVLAL
jgi:ribosomal protein S18 acetylase RimI-like enzyme